MNVKVRIKGYKELDSNLIDSFEKKIAEVIPYYRIEIAGVASKNKKRVSV